MPIVVSEELKFLFKKAYFVVKEHGGRNIPLSIVTYLIFEKYLKDGQGEDPLLNKFFEYVNLDSKEKKSFLKDLEDIKSEILDDEECFKIPSDYPFSVGHEESLPMDQYLMEALERAKKQHPLWFGKKEEDEVTASSLFLSIAWDCGEPVLSDHLNNFGFTKKNFISCISENKNISKLQTKRIESPDIENPFRNSGSMKFGDGIMPSSSPKNNIENDDKMFEEAGKRDAINSKSVNPDSTTPYLDLYSYDMSSAAKMGKYDPVVGRTMEIDQIIEILCCRKKNNTILLGDPGCGKTAVVELLAQRIESGKIPSPLKGKRICSLDLNALVSGTKYRGEYEQRLQGIIKEVCMNPNIIIYIDEFHNLVGNGGNAGNGDGANILKPYLARGEFQCIGSTTVEEYRKWVEKDGALKRRFQNVYIDEPTSEDTLSILETLSKKYGDYHNVKYSGDVLKACVEWSGRYIQDRYFPDKAIDCLDMAGSLAKLENKSTSGPTTLETLQKNLEEIKTKKTNALLDNRFDESLELKIQQEELEKKIVKEREKGITNKERATWPGVTLDHVAKVVSKISKVPIDKISSSDMEKIRNMKNNLEKKVIGQDEAVGKVTISLQRNFLGLRDPKKPIASLLLVGPTGTGKTLICKEMAKEFFGTEKALIKFDMAEFSERHEVTKLTGSTASYVGYDDTPLLEQVRRNPYSVILFDEIEKAAPEIFSIFLSLLDEGIITLGNGQRVDFKNCIVVFTGNVGTKEIAVSGGGKGIGFGGTTVEEIKKNQEKIVMKAVEKTFRPEFINRLTSITVFNELHKPEMLKIFDLEIQKLKDRLKAAGYSLSVDKKVKELCVSQCDPRYGARDLQRAITRNIEDNICKEMLNAEGEIGKKISIRRGTEEEIVVEFKSSTPKKKSAPKEEILEEKKTETPSEKSPEETKEII